MHGDEPKTEENMSNTASVSSRANSPESRRNQVYEVGGKVEIEEDQHEVAPPALPPRPLSRPTNHARRPTSRNNCNCEFAFNPELMRNSSWTPRSCWSNGLRKYVFLCIICGALSVLLGALFLTVYFMLKSYTSSLNYFETVPTYVPAAMLMTTGFLISCLACRKNRNSFLMKLCGACSLLCAVLCLSVTVTTAVIHMNRLQTLRECYYTGKTRSCTCESVIIDNEAIGDDSVKFVFNSTSDCEVIHGVLYSCLRAIFGLSVVGILICIFTCMLVYQLLSHEKKKMYWAQLEMRCRYLYGQHGQQPFCTCCDDCRYPAPTPHEMFPWDLFGNRFLTPGRVGNLYTPNPEEGSEQSRQGWSWRRLPWGRNTNNAQRVRPDISSPDSQYGFTNTNETTGETTVEGAPYTVIDNRPQTNRPDCPSAFPGDDITEGGFYYWGPPPPYSSNPNSSNNSPARRSLSGLLNQVSPLRRYNVSPARVPQNRPIREPLIFERSPNFQASGVQKNVSVTIRGPSSSRHPAITNIIQKQLANSSHRSSSMTSISQCEGENKTENYENTTDLNLINQNRLLGKDSISGFNTLPSLKKKSHAGLSDCFPTQFPNGSVASVENIISDIKAEDGLSPRMYCLKSTNGSDDSRVPNDAGNVECKPQTSTNIGLYKRDRAVDHNSQADLKNTRTSGKSNDIYQNDILMECAKKKVARKLDYNINQTSRDHLRSRNIGETSQAAKNSTKKCAAKPPRSTPVTPEHGEGHKKEVILQQHKIINDPDLIKKHGSLIQEFNIIQHIKSKKEEESKKNPYKLNAFENFAFQHLEKEVSDSLNGFGRNKSDNSVEISLIGYQSKKSNRQIGQVKEEGRGKDIRGECESDVYFGDISNSSCYMSLRSERPESLYDEAIEPKTDKNNGQPLLNKMNLKLIDKESCKMDAKVLEYNEVLSNSSSSTESTASSGSKRMRNGSEHSLESFCSNSSGIFQTCSHKGRETSASPDKLSESFSKKVLENRDQYPLYPDFSSKDLIKRVFPSNTHQLPNQFRPVREPFHSILHSNDEQSSSSLTADSGISSGRTYLPWGYFSEKSQQDNLSNDSESSLDIIKTSNSTEKTLCPSSELASAIFQKPKVQPRISRNRDDLDCRQDIEQDEVKIQNYAKKTKRHYSVNLSLQSAEDCKPPLEDKLPPHPKPRVTTTTKVIDSSPKPLPRTTLEKNKVNISESENRPTSENKYKSFLAPDAQYDFTESKIKTNKPKISKIIHGSPRCKPIVPARPLNLPPKPMEKSYRHSLNLVTPIRRRQREPSELSTGVDYLPTASHSVNV